MQITLPNPSLVILIGVSGSGKSTFARAHFAPTEILSSDHCRALICDDETDQAVNRDAFELLHVLVAKRLAYRRLTVIDATNVQTEARAPLLALARRHRVPAVALVFDFDVAICLQRNAQRVQRIVPREVILQQQHDLQASFGTLSAEGFHALYVFASPVEAADIQIERKKSRRWQSDAP